MRKNKLNWLIAITVSVTILTMGGVIINQIGISHQENKLIIDECFDNFDNGGAVVVEKEDFWSPVTCEKE